MTPALLALFLYLAVQFGIGAWVSRRIRTEADYLVAGRQLGPVLLTFSIFATWFGAETVIGSAGVVYSEGVSLTSAEPFGYGLCLILMGLVFAVPLWRRQLTTLADLFRQRFSAGVERLAAVILIPGSVLWAAAQMRAFGQVIASASGSLDVDAAIFIAAAVVMLYTAFGGLLADALTDVVQGIVLAIGLIVVTIATFNAVGGIDPALAALRAPRATSGSWLEIAEAWAIPVCGSVIATELVGRIVGARSGVVARRASLTAGALYISIGLMPVLMGLVGAQLLPNLTDGEQLLPRLAEQLLPTALYAVFVGGLVSAILSTVDSTLLVASGLLSHNLLVPLLRLGSEKQKVRLARAGVFLFGLIAYVLAINSTGVFELVEQASAFGSAGALVTVSFGLFTTLGGPRTAAATLLAGVVGYLGPVMLGSEYPFLISLGTALAVYLTGAALELSLSPRTETVPSRS